MHTQSFTIPQFLKIGLTHKKQSPVESPTVATCPFAGERGEAHGCAFQGRKDARSRHQRLFVENVGKTEGNRSKRKFQVRELYLRLRKVDKSGALAPTYPPSKRKSDLRSSFLRVNQAILFT
ncbi:hypothetical protein HKD37_18G050429 [Glycine soja]